MRRHRGRGRSSAAARPGCPAASSRMTWALVPLTPKDETPGAARPLAGRPRPRLGEQLARRPADQSTCGVGASTCRVRGSVAVPHRLHHLDDSGDAGGGLGVTDVRLHRAQPQRPAVRRGPGRRPPAAPAPRSGRRASCRCRAPRPRRRRRAEARRRPAPGAMTRCWDGAVGGGEPVAGAVLVDRADPRTTASTWCPWRRASDSRSSTRTPAPSRPAGAVGGGRERLAPAVGGEARADG